MTLRGCKVCGNNWHQLQHLTTLRKCQEVSKLHSRRSWQHQVAKIININREMCVLSDIRQHTSASNPVFSVRNLPNAVCLARWYHARLTPPLDKGSLYTYYLSLLPNKIFCLTSIIRQSHWSYQSCCCQSSLYVVCPCSVRIELHRSCNFKWWIWKGRLVSIFKLLEHFYGEAAGSPRKRPAVK